MKQIELDVISYIKFLNKLLTLDFDKRLSEYGLTCQQGRVLFYIYRKTNEGLEVHQNDIEKQFNLSKSTVSGLVKRMMKNDLINKNQSHPYCTLTPSEKGCGIVDNIHKNRLKTTNKILQGFDEKQQKEINNLLEKMIKNMEKEETNDVEENKINS